MHTKHAHAHTLNPVGRQSITHVHTLRARTHAHTYLESRRAPVDELDGSLRLYSGDGGVDVFGHDVAAKQETAGHVLPVARIALHLRKYMIFLVISFA